jgi:hypothetical protein
MGHGVAEVVGKQRQAPVQRMQIGISRAAVQVLTGNASRGFEVTVGEQILGAPPGLGRAFLRFVRRRVPVASPHGSNFPASAIPGGIAGDSYLPGSARGVPWWS